jgi:hypothetical protein
VFNSEKPPNQHIKCLVVTICLHLSIIIFDNMFIFFLKGQKYYILKQHKKCKIKKKQ